VGSVSTPDPSPATVRRRLGEAERREQILRATVRVVAKLGVDAASAHAIAAEAGVSKGLIWHYFEDKTDLMKQAVIQAARGIRDEVVASVDPQSPAPERIRNYILTVARLRMARQEEFRATDRIAARLENADGTPVFSARDYEELYAGQVTIFRNAQQDGSFGDFDPRVMAVTYQGAIDAMFAYLDSHPDVDVEAYAGSLADILLAAMTRQPARSRQSGRRTQP